MIDPQTIRRHLQVLTDDIGVRLAGSPGEQRAAEYIAEQFAAAGADVHMETFPARERAVALEQLEVCIGDAWQSFPCSLLSNAPGTDNLAVEAPLAVMDAVTGYQVEDLSRLRGKAVIHLGSHIERASDYERLMAVAPVFLLFVDTRYPAGSVTADGLFPAYVVEHGAVPTVSVAYLDAWDWVAGNATAARLRVNGGMRPGQSQNVVAEIPGAGSEFLVVGAHHDTQADSVGADDNADGVAALLALTRGLAKTPGRRGVRLISFGAEEQLSVGSAEYVRRHRRELANHCPFMFNFDAFGSVLGWFNLVCNGGSDLAAYLAPAFKDRGLPVHCESGYVPYADHFPFVAAGVPSAWLSRDNCTAGRFFHHRPDDDLSRVSCERVADSAAVVGEILRELVNISPLPFVFSEDPEPRAIVAGMWQDLFGGWSGFDWHNAAEQQD